MLYKVATAAVCEAAKDGIEHATSPLYLERRS